MKRLIPMLLMAVASLKGAAATIPDTQAIKAIIGEAGSQPFACQVAVANAIRHRGSLRGVYGVKNPVVKRASRAVVERARQAWELSRRTDLVPGLRYFGCPSDAPYFHRIGLHPALTMGAITFYR
jgi:hypothetical protein